MELEDLAYNQKLIMKGFSGQFAFRLLHFLFGSILFLTNAAGGELRLDRSWLAASTSEGSLVATLPDSDPDVFQLIQAGQVKVLWEGGLLDTQPIPNEPTFEFSVPSELRHPGFTRFHLWDAERGLPLAYEARVAVVILSNAQIFEVNPETNRVAAYEPSEPGGDGGRIALYELSTGNLVREIQLSAPRQVLAFTPSLGHAWIAENPAAGNVVRFSLTTEEVDQTFQVSFGAPPYQTIEAQVDRSDPSLLVVRADHAVRAFRNGALLPGFDVGVDVFPLPLDDQGRYIVEGDQVCRLDSQLGFVACQALLGSRVRAVWKDRLADSRRIYAAPTGLQLRELPFGNPIYLPESNRIFVSSFSRTGFVDGDSLEVLFEGTLGELVQMRQANRVATPDWLLAPVEVLAEPSTSSESAILVGRFGEFRPSPTFSDEGVVHGGSFKRGALSPGQIISIFGENLGPEPGAQLLFESQLRLGTRIGGVRVLFEGVEGTVLYAGSQQINVVVPGTVDGEAAVRVQVVRDNIPSERVSMAVAAARPGLFGYFAAGRRYAAALHVDGRLQGPAAPLSRGDPVSLFGTGLGLPAGLKANRIADRAASTPVVPSVTIGGKPAEVLYSGGSPGLTAGLFQVNAVVPLDVPVGSAVEVVVEANGLTEGDTWLAIQ